MLCPCSHTRTLADLCGQHLSALHRTWISLVLVSQQPHAITLGSVGPTDSTKLFPLMGPVEASPRRPKVSQLALSLDFESRTERHGNNELVLFLSHGYHATTSPWAPEQSILGAPDILWRHCFSVRIAVSHGTLKCEPFHVNRIRPFVTSGSVSQTCSGHSTHKMTIF